MCWYCKNRPARAGTSFVYSNRRFLLAQSVNALPKHLQERIKNIRPFEVKVPTCSGCLIAPPGFDKHSGFLPWMVGAVLFAILGTFVLFYGPQGVCVLIGAGICVYLAFLPKSVEEHLRRRADSYGPVRDAWRSSDDARAKELPSDLLPVYLELKLKYLAMERDLSSA